MTKIDEAVPLSDLTVKKRLILSQNGVETASEDGFRRDHNHIIPTSPPFCEKILPSVTCHGILETVLPSIFWLKSYNIKSDLFGDIVAGLTVAVMQIPHGLAFAPLGGQPPVVGLYMAVFPLIIYTIFGTSKHVSLGMFAVLIMMVGKTVNSHSTVIVDGSNETVVGYTAMEVGIAVSFTVGIWQLILGVIHLGSLCVLLSNCVVSGFTSGAAIHVAFIQLKNILKIPASMKSGPFKLLFFVQDIITRITEIHLATILISISVMIVLICFNKYLKPMIAKKSKVPVPIEFLLIVISIIVSNLVHLREKLDIAVVGPVPIGLPDPVVPPFSLIPIIIWECLVIALVNITVNISLATIFAKKGDYTIDGNQELRAYGLSNIFGSFFQCLPVCASLSRTMVQYSVGGKTQLANLFSVLTVLLILLFIGSVFEQVPLCVLAAIVLVTLQGLLQQMADLPEIWSNSHKEGIIWLLTFMSVVLFDLDYGIAIGIFLSIVNLLLIGTDVEVVSLAAVPYKHLYIDSSRYHDQTHSLPNVFILQILGALNFANCDSVIKKIRKMTIEQGPCQYVIVNLSSVPYVDASFVSVFSTFYKELKEQNVEFFMTNCCYIYKNLESCDLFKTYPKENVILTVNDVINYLRDNNAI